MNQQLDTQDSTDVQAAEGDLIETSPESQAEVKDINLMDENDPQVQALGTQSIETQNRKGFGEFISDFIYESDSAFVREYLQNSETACIRAAKYLLRRHPDYGEEWLTQKLWVDEETGETIRPYTQQDAEQARLPDGENTDEWDGRRVIEVPRPLREVVQAAREIGYDPTITIDVYRDDREIVWEDNGIGMTLYEFKEGFMNNFSSGSAKEEDTGGKFGVGAKASALAHGKEGGMTGVAVTRRDDVPDYSKKGVAFYSYLGGANLRNIDKLRDRGEVSNDFRGTRFTIPVCDEFSLNMVEEWVEKYAELLRVPVLYREHRSGQNRVNEEYGGTSFEEYHDEPPVVIDRPGEFTAVDGPNVVGYKEPDTWLVSMLIDRNTNVSVRALWGTAVQIHDEQGRIVSGPNRGRYADGYRVYETRAKENQVGQLHEDDVPLPQPVGSRDNFQQDEHNTRFFEYLHDAVKEAELSEVSETAEEMQEKDHPAEAIAKDERTWELFKKMVNYHGPYNVMNSDRRFKKFINKRDEFPDYNDETLDQVWGLFDEVGHARKNSHRPNKKKGREERRLGDILAEADRDKTFMGCTINGDRHTVVYNTYPDDGAVIRVSGASKYSIYQENFGFTKLKEVPKTQSDDHEFDVPDPIHKANQNKGPSGGQTKADTTSERTLKIRCDPSNKQIDKRYTIENARRKLTNGLIGGHSELIVFPRAADESVSDHTGMQSFGAIASVTSEELDELHDHPDVFTYEEFCERSLNTVIATEQGGIKVRDLFEDERLVILAYKSSHADQEIKRLVKQTDEKRRLRECLKSDIIDQAREWHPENMDDPEVLFGVVDEKTLELAEYGLYSNRSEGGPKYGIRFTSISPGTTTPITWKPLNRSYLDYKRKAATPEWDNESPVYGLFGGGDVIEDVLFGFHDAGIDPTGQDTQDLREAVGKGAVMVDFGGGGK
jgi:hypothetical protein